MASSVSKYAPKAEYQKANTGLADKACSKWWKNLSLTKPFNEGADKTLQKVRHSFLSSPFDVESVQLLHDLKIDLIKVPSGEITIPYLKKVAATGLPVIFSTGMATMEDISNHECAFCMAGVKWEHYHFALQHAIPTPYADVNLKAMNTIRGKIRVAVGYSDHTLGIEVPIAAVSLGAVVIENILHLTEVPGPWPCGIPWTRWAEANG